MDLEGKILRSDRVSVTQNERNFLHFGAFSSFCGVIAENFRSQSASPVSHHYLILNYLPAPPLEEGGWNRPWIVEGRAG